MLAELPAEVPRESRAHDLDIKGGHSQFLVQFVREVTTGTLQQQVSALTYEKKQVLFANIDKTMSFLADNSVTNQMARAYVRDALEMNRDKFVHLDLRFSKYERAIPLLKGLFPTCGLESL